MDESLLKKAAVLVFLLGFLGLFVLFNLAKPDIISPRDILPEDELVSFNATISEIYETESGSFVLLHRKEEVRGMLDAPLPVSLAGRQAVVTGRLQEGWFAIEEITVSET